MILQGIEFLLWSLIAVPDLSQTIAAEAKRLEELIPEDQRKGMAEKEIGVALERLGQLRTDLTAGRTYQALSKLAGAESILEPAAYLSRYEKRVVEPEAFLALWEAERQPLEEEAATLSKRDFSKHNALVRAFAELSTYRILPHYRAARMYAKAGISGGLFYLGSARADAAFASFCARLEDDSRGSSPKFRPLAVVEAELSKESVAAYGLGDASTEHHREFIRLDSALKEARALIAEDRTYGTAWSLLEARLRLGLIRSPEGVAAPDPDRAPYRARLLDPAFDHSLATSLWERAVDRAASSEDTDRREAVVLLEEVIPFYFELLED